MPAKNLYHDAVRASLEADGWTITDDPLGVVVGRRQLHIDIGADRAAFGAEQAGRRIAVEVQSFVSRSAVDDLHRAVGQYAVYRAVLRVADPGRALFLAVAADVYDAVFSEPLGQLVAADVGIAIVVFDPINRRVTRWTS